MMNLTSLILLNLQMVPHILLLEINFGKMSSPDSSIDLVDVGCLLIISYYENPLRIKTKLLLNYFIADFTSDDPCSYLF